MNQFNFSCEELLMLPMLSPDELIDELSRYVTLSHDEALALLARMRKIEFKKRDTLQNTGDRADHFYWIREGCTMASYFDANGQEHVMQFAVAHWWTTDLNGFLQNTESELTIQALTDGWALAIRSDDYEALLEECPVYERYFRKIFANALVVHQRRIMRTIGADAEAHYRAYLRDYPGIDQWVPQKYIASYLGITPEFLSKLRRRMVSK